jgi:hypothetical protein
MGSKRIPVVHLPGVTSKEREGIPGGPALAPAAASTGLTYIGQVLGWNHQPIVPRHLPHHHQRRSPSGSRTKPQSPGHSPSPSPLLPEPTDAYTRELVSRKRLFSLSLYVDRNPSVASSHPRLFVLGQGDPEPLLPACTTAWNGTSPVPLDRPLASPRSNAAGLLEYVDHARKNNRQVNAHTLCVIDLGRVAGAGSPGLLDGAWFLKHWPGTLYAKYRSSCSVGADTGPGEEEDGGSDENLSGMELFDAEGRPVDSEAMYAWLAVLLSRHTLLGLMTFTNLPQRDMVECIQDLAQAGLRFVYFSSRDERCVKDVGDKLGLETDWNACILLPDVTQHTKQTPSGAAVHAVAEAGDLVLPSGDNHLPIGISAIRPHLRRIDNIPLHVSLFAEASSHATADMLRIYGESGEVVLYWASSLSGSDLRESLCARLAIFVDPLEHDSATVRAEDGVTEGSLAGKGWNALEMVSALHAVVTRPLRLKKETSPYILTQTLQEARSLKHAYHQVRKYELRLHR